MQESHFHKGEEVILKSITGSSVKITRIKRLVRGGGYIDEEGNSFQSNGFQRSIRGMAHWHILPMSPELREEAERQIAINYIEWFMSNHNRLKNLDHQTAQHIMQILKEQEA